MNIKSFLVCLVFIQSAKAQLQLCGSTYCDIGSRCYSGLCLPQFFFGPSGILNTFQSSSECPATPCPSDQICQESKCVPLSTYPTYTYPTATAPPISLQRDVLPMSSYPYAPFYCDQNIYRICEKFDSTRRPQTQGYAVIITNYIRQAYVRQQRTGNSKTSDFLVKWNYHVVFITKTPGTGSNFYDFDSFLDWGVRFEEAWRKQLETKAGEPTSVFRVIPYRNYLTHFASDRGGNIQKLPDGTFRYKRPPPPNTNIIVNKLGKTSTLSALINLTNFNPQYGNILYPTDFYRFFS